MDYILALDAGTTSIKAVLFDTQGCPAAIGAREYELSKPAPNIVELAPEIYWEAATAAIREVLPELDRVPGTFAVLYATWRGRYDDLEAFARAVRGGR